MSLVPKILDERHRSSLHRYSVIALIVIGVVVTGCLTWMATTPIAGASIVPGSLEVDGRPQDIQSRESAAVIEILVRNGDIVAAGEVILRLDDSELQTQQTDLGSRLALAEVREARLLAQQAGATQIQAAEVNELDREFQDLRQTEQAALDAYWLSYSASRDQVSRQIDQLEGEQSGIAPQLAEIASQLDIVEEQLVLVSGSTTPSTAGQLQVLELEAEISSLRGQQAALQARQQQIAGAIGERQAELRGLDANADQATLDELRTAQAEVASLKTQLEIVDLRLETMVVRAPVSGAVVGMNVNTVGELAAAGQTLLSIVPDADIFALLRVPAAVLDTIAVGETILLRLPTLDRLNVELEGRISRIAPGISTEPGLQEGYYEVSVALSPDSVERDLLVSGLPIEAHVSSEDQTVMQFLVRPLLDQFSRSFVEE